MSKPHSKEATPCSGGEKRKEEKDWVEEKVAERKRDDISRTASVRKMVQNVTIFKRKTTRSHRDRLGPQSRFSALKGERGGNEVQ